jgi:P-type conjugative transfer protein TrbJ
MHTFFAIIKRAVASCALTIMVGAMALTGTLAPTPAHAQLATVCVNCAAIWTQIMEYAQQVETAVNTANQLEYQIKAYKNAVTQGNVLPNQVWGNFMNDLNRLNSLTTQTRGLAYTSDSLTSDFARVFPGYQKYLDQPATPAQAGQMYDQWSGETYDASRNAMATAGMQVGQMRDEEDVMQELQAHSSNAEGQMQAMQAGNEIAAQQVRQMQKLRELVSTNISMQATAMANEQREKDRLRAAQDAADTDQPQPFSGAAKSY